jgi:sulfur-carrier protein
MIEILYFARIRELVGQAKESATPPANVNDVGTLANWLRERGEPWRTALAPDKALRIAVNQRMAQAATPLADGDEVAFFPPVTGG